MSEARGLPPGAAFAKRGFDIVFSALGLVLAAPVILLAWIVASIDTGANGFYAQARIGRFGRPFRVIKIRTMRPGSDAGSTVTTATDARVTPAGRFFRRSNIDELPQLFNVLAGHMSLVGPRPVEDAQLSDYGEHLDAYLAVKPGLTGLWQATGRNRIPFPARAAVDAYYSQRCSLLLDLWIIARTPLAVLLRRGAD